MKISSIFGKRWKNFVERKTFCSKCLAKDIKHEQLLKRQPKQILIFIVNLILLNFVCLKFSVNFV